MLDKRIKTIQNPNDRLRKARIPAEEINWDYLDHLIKTQGTTKTDLSRKLGYSDSFITQCFSGHIKLPVEDVEKILKWFKVDEKALFTSLTEAEPVEEPAPDNDHPINLLELESDFEKTVRKTLEDITTKMEMLLELESKVNAINSNIGELMERVPKISYPDLAVKILEKTLDDAGMGGRTCEYSKYLDALEAKRVPKSYAIDAVNRIGATVNTTGYGMGKTMWVVRGKKR